MKIGITGASGVLGFHLAEWFSYDDEFEVKALVKSLDEPAVPELKSLNGVEVYEGDVSNFEFVNNLFSDVDYVFHLAAISSEHLALQNPLNAFKVNVLGTVNILETVRLNGIKKMVFSSSAAVYPRGNHPKEEDAQPPMKFYGATKWTSEYFIKLYAEKFDINYTIFRFSRIYGKYMQRNPVYDMVLAFLKDMPVEMYDSFDAVYDFLYVKDAVKAMVKAIDGLDREVINVGGTDGKGVRVGEIYNILSEMFGGGVEFKFVMKREGVDVPDVSRARELGIEPSYDLSEGLMETVEGFRQILKLK